MTEASFLNETSSKSLQVPLVMVQRRTAVLLVGTPVTPDVGELGVVIVAVPLISVQVPVPEVGLLPAKVKMPLLHCD